MERTLVLDTETTGIVPGLDRLTEIAILEFDAETGRPTGDSFYTLLNPEREIPPEVTAVHGKTYEDLKGEPKFADIADALLKYVEGARVVIHNAPFDVGHLDAELKALRKGTLDKRVASVIDTLSLSRRHTTAKKHTLDALCDRYGVDRSARTLHGAFIDCEMLAAVFPPLMKEVNRLIDLINSVLPFPLQSPLLETLEGNAERALILADVIKVLEQDRKRYLDAVKKQAVGNPFENDVYELTFTPTSRTDWDKVKAAHLQGVNLAPYQTPGSTMNLKYR